MKEEKTSRAQFATKIGVLAATVGSAVGLGNIWRFPYETGANGGAAFLLIYIGFVLLIGIPVIAAEFTIGKTGRATATRIFSKLGYSRRWSSIGYLGLLTALLLMGFYTVVSGWTLEYLFASVSGQLTAGDTSQMHIRFDEFTQNSWRPLMWTVVFIIINYIVISRGVEKGIEKVSNILMPLLFLILIVFCIYSLTMPGAAAGLSFFFHPDFSKITSGTVLSAMGQAFFSLSVGMGVLLTYASYFDRKTNIVRTASLTALLDTLVAVLSGIVIFPAVFTFGMEPSGGPRLVFEVLPSIFNHLPGGTYLGILFFLLLFVASLTSTISITEVMISYLTEERHLSRGRACWICGVATIALASVASLSFGPLKNFTLFGLTFFNFLDFLASNIMLPVCGLLLCIFAGWVYAGRRLRMDMLPEGVRSSVWVDVIVMLVKYVAPPAILIIFIYGLL